MKLFQLLSHFSDKSLFHTNFTTTLLIKEIDLLLSVSGHCDLRIYPGNMDQKQSFYVFTEAVA